MKKIYLMAALFAVGFTAQAQFTDDLESYGQGPLFTERWTTWDGNNDGAQNIVIQAEQQFSGAFSGKISPGVLPSGGPQDALLDLGGVAQNGSGVWTLQFMMYIPSGNSGYFNIQGSVDPSANDNLQFMSGNIVFNESNGSPGIGEDQNGTGLSLFQFPHDAWFPVTITCDTDLQTYQLTIADSVVPAVPYQAATATQPFAEEFGGIDFFAQQPETTYFIDDVVFVQGTLGTNDFAAEAFSIYPNPIKDQLNINGKVSVDSVVIYDVLGKVVLTANPSTSNPIINTAGLASGAYLVKIISNGSSQTIKVLK